MQRAKARSYLMWSVAASLAAFPTGSVASTSILSTRVRDLLLPHLKQLRRRAASRRRASALPVNGVERLTRREREVLQRVAEGKTNAEVASLLRISPETVRKHLENAYEKLGVHTRTRAVAALFQLDVEIA